MGVTAYCIYNNEHNYCEAEEVGPNVMNNSWEKNSLNNSHDVCEVHKSWQNDYVSCS